MSARNVVHGEPVSPGSSRQGRRLESIDVFRGLTILSMVFVNDLAHFVKGVPPWMRHMPPGQDGMTFVDLVFPGFLFIVGMAIPLALARRQAAGASGARMATHVLLRTIGLLVVGVFMVNMHGLDPVRTGMSLALWTLLTFCAVIVVWNRYPATSGRTRWVFGGLRLAGVAVLAGLAVVYRGRDGGWMHTQWWGILGLIGWSYLTACIAYKLAGERIAGLVTALSLLIVVYAADPSPALKPSMGIAAGRPTGALDFLGSPGSWWSIRGWVWIGGHIGTHSAITAAGIIATLLVTQVSASVQRRSAWMLAMAACLLAAGYCLRPLYGVAKNETTPAYCLYSSAICTLIYLGLWLIIDVAGMRRGWGLLRLEGANPLLAYILPSMIDSAQTLLGSRYLAEHFNYGTVGIIRSLATAIVVVLIAGSAARLRVRLQF